MTSWGTSTACLSCCSCVFFYRPLSWMPEHLPGVLHYYIWFDLLASPQGNNPVQQSAFCLGGGFANASSNVVCCPIREGTGKEMFLALEQKMVSIVVTPIYSSGPDLRKPFLLYRQGPSWGGLHCHRKKVAALIVFLHLWLLLNVLGSTMGDFRIKTDALNLTRVS